MPLSRACIVDFHALICTQMDMTDNVAPRYTSTARVINNKEMTSFRKSGNGDGISIVDL